MFLIIAHFFEDQRDWGNELMLRSQLTFKQKIWVNYLHSSGINCGAEITSFVYLLFTLLRTIGKKQSHFSMTLWYSFVIFTVNTAKVVNL